MLYMLHYVGVAGRGCGQSCDCGVHSRGRERLDGAHTPHPDKDKPLHQYGSKQTRENKLRLL